MGIAKQPARVLSDREQPPREHISWEEPQREEVTREEPVLKQRTVEEWADILDHPYPEIRARSSADFWLAFYWDRRLNRRLLDCLFESPNLP